MSNLPLLLMGYGNLYSLAVHSHVPAGVTDSLVGINSGIRPLQSLSINSQTATIGPSDLLRNKKCTIYQLCVSEWK